jgi:hypothetical protein
MEDAATAEISRSQVWQWVVSPKGMLDDGRKVTVEMVRPMIAEELAKVKATVTAQGEDTATYDQAAVIFDKMSLTPEYPEFLTLPLYEAMVFLCAKISKKPTELKKTVHYKNRSGTTVQCADCHVASSKTPTDYIFKSFQKLIAAPRRDRPHTRAPSTRRRNMRSLPSDNGRARVGTHEGSRLEGMPQLPRLQDHGPGEAKGPVGDQTRRRHRRRQDLHRLPQGHRAQAGSSEEGPGASTASRSASRCRCAASCRKSHGGRRNRCRRMWPKPALPRPPAPPRRPRRQCLRPPPQ